MRPRRPSGDAASRSRVRREHGPHRFPLIAGCGVAPQVGERADDMEPAAGLGESRRPLSPPEPSGPGRRPRTARMARAAAGQAAPACAAESRRRPAARAAARWSPAQTRRSQHRPRIPRRPTAARWRRRNPGPRGPALVSCPASGWRHAESTSSPRDLVLAIAASSRWPRRPSGEPVPASSSPRRWLHCPRGSRGVLSSPSVRPRRGGRTRICASSRMHTATATAFCTTFLHEPSALALGRRLRLPPV